jgi:hypothetical protein
MKPIALATLSGAAGFIAGALVYGWFAAHTLDMRNQMVQTQFAVEQEFRAVRAERQGDLLGALHAQWSTVEARSAEWLHTNFETPPPWFAFAFITLERIERSTDPEGKGRRADQGLARGHLAYLLDANGYKTRAAEQWQVAAKLAGVKDSEKIQKLIATLRAQQDSELHRQVEQQFLGPESVAR